MFMAVLTLLVALAISFVAAWYSIVGLMAIFSAAATAIAIMGAVLEVGKLLTASWLYQNWKTTHRLLKYYLTVAVVVLMFITSMGIFGFLSKAHIDQTLVSGDNGLKIELIDKKIKREENRIEDANKVITQLDLAVETLIEYDRIRGPSGSIATREKQQPERDQLNGVIDKAADNIAVLNQEKLVLEKEQIKFEAEVGPIKYIAALFTNDVNELIIEQAVRWVIITIIFVFDPLAVLLVIAANISIMQLRNKPKKMVSAVNVDNEWNDFEAETDEVDEQKVEEDLRAQKINENEPPEIGEPEQKRMNPRPKHHVDRKFHGIDKKK